MELKGTLTAVGNLTGTLSSTSLLTGVLTSTSSLEAKLSSTQNLSASLTTPGTLSGILSTVGALTAELSMDNIEYPDYSGAMSVTPIPYDSITLNTDNRILREDITIEPIPFYKTTNESGGYTAIIGG